MTKVIKDQPDAQDLDKIDQFQEGNGSTSRTPILKLK